MQWHERCDRELGGEVGPTFEGFCGETVTWARDYLPLSFASTSYEQMDRSSRSWRRGAGKIIHES